MITTLAEAEKALRDAEFDVANEYGEDFVDDAYGDLVEGICTMITDPEIQAELIRTKLGWIPSWAPPKVVKILRRTWGGLE